MAGAPGSRWTERWGEIAVLVGVWACATLVVWGVTLLPDVRHAWNVRRTRGLPIAEAIAESDGSLVRVRGLPAHAPGVTTLRDQSGGAVELPGIVIGTPDDPRVEAVGCLDGARLGPCRAAPLLAGPPAEVRAAEGDLALRASLLLAAVLGGLGFVLYAAGRLLGAPLGRRVRKGAA